MKSNIVELSSLERKLNIQVPVDLVKKTFDQIYNSFQKQAEIKGFRKGKAPLATIRMMYAEQIKNEALQDLLRKHYYQAVVEHKLEPISHPNFEFDDLHEGKDFNFSAAFEIRPQVELKKYTDFDVQKEKLEISDSQINTSIENIRNSRATLQNIIEDRAAQLGDTVTIDYSGFVDGAPLEGGTAEKQSLELGSNSFIAGFEEGIVGMRIGESRSLNLSFPDPYHAAHLTGKPVRFEVKLHEIKKKVLPDLDENFFKELGIEGGLESLKETIRKDLERNESRRIDEAFRNALLKKLVELNPTDVPPSFLKEQKAELLENFKRRMTEQGLPAEEFNTYAEKWDKDFEKTAGDMIRTNFLIDAIAAKHDLYCTDQDVENKINEHARQTGLDAEKIRGFYSDEGPASRLKYSITEEKVIGFLNSKINIQEVSKDKLKAE